MKASEAVRMIQAALAKHGDHELEIQVEEPGESDEMLCVGEPVGMDVYDDDESPLSLMLVVKATGVSGFWESTGGRA